jgi:hypothetical protein
MMILFIGCHNKNTDLGFPGSSFDNYDITFNEEVFDDIYTFEDNLSQFPNNQKLILGNYQGADIRMLMRFVNLPTNITLTEDPTISLIISRKRNPMPMEISVAGVGDKIFLQNFATWERYNDTALWTTPGGDIIDTTAVTSTFTNAEDETSVTIRLDRKLVQKWINDSNFLLNYGVIVSTSGISDSFVEFFSGKSGAGVRPTINLKFTNNATGTPDSLSRPVSYDTFIHSYLEHDLNPDILCIGNIYPTSVYAKVDLPYHVFDGVYEASCLQKVNIMQAQLILSVNESISLNTNPRFNISIGLPVESFLDRQTSFDYSAGSMYRYAATIDTLRAGKMYINITTPLQQIFSNNRQNNGFVLLNSYRNMDFSRLYIYNKDADNPELRPKLRIRYSVYNPDK